MSELTPETLAEIERGKRLVKAFEDAAADLEMGAFAEVIATENGHLRCPHCGNENQYTELDYGYRQNPTTFHGERELRVNQGERDFATLAFQCDNCEGLVNMHPAASVDWDI